MGHLNGFLAWWRGYLSINGAVWGNVEAWLVEKAISPHSTPPGMFSQERCLLLSTRDSIQMTLNLSGIWSRAVTDWRSCYIVLAIVYKWRTKDKWWLRYAVKCNIRSASLILLASSVVRCACPSIPRALVVVCVVACSNAFFCIPALWHVWPVFSSSQSIFLLTCNFFSVLVFFYYVWAVFSQHLLSFVVSELWWLNLQRFPPTSLPYFHWLSQCDGCLFSSLVHGG